MEGECSTPGIVSQSGKPIRVIDVAATISSVGGVCFKQPNTTTDFHVISHTWSQKVREFSKEIGALSQSSSGTYNNTFRVADFSKSECYKDLKEFLKMLEDDGVEYVWFDALCIDQTNATEKGVEIARMAGYFSYNKGCYVLTHGIGNGYSFWGKSDSGKIALPRWFKRAWTLQEYLLPTKLTFLVAFEPMQELLIVIYIIAQLRQGFCKCCIISTSCAASLVKNYKERYNIYEEIQGIVKWTYYARHAKCQTCGSFPLVRTATKKDAKEIVYFIDRDAYTIISTLLCDAPHNKRAWEERERDWERTAIELLAFLLRHESPMTVALNIAKRICTNEEDRILCILGLLESNNVEPVRTGLSLNDQILRVCKNNDDLLIQLCAMSIKGNSMLGMSWVPWLIPDHANDCLVTLATQYRRRQCLSPGKIRRDVEVVDVGPEGIKLRGKITRTLVLGCPQHKYSRMRFLSKAGVVLDIGGPFKVVLNVAIRRYANFGLSPTSSFRGYLWMPLNNYDNVCEVDFEMWWILLGDANVDCKVVMACIGGFGEFLDEYVTPSSTEDEILDEHVINPQ